METAEMTIHSDGFNRVQMEQPHRAPQNTLKSGPPHAKYCSIIL